MAVADELIVALKSEGANEAQQDIENVGETTEEVGDNLEETADDAEGFRAEFQGAIGAAVAGLAVGVGGLASQVPIVGELFAGLFSIVSAVGFQLDKLARSLGAGGITQSLYGVSEALFAAEGAAGKAVGLIGGLVAAFGTAAAAASAYIIQTQGIVAGLTTIGGAIKTVVVGLGSLIAGISATTAALAIGVAAVVAFAAAYLTNFRGVRDKTNSFLGDIYNSFLNLAGNLTTWAGKLADKAVAWGRNIVESMIDGIRSAISRLRAILGNIQTTIESRLDINIGGDGGGDDGGGIGSGFLGSVFGGGGGGSQIDGRQLSESTGRYRAGPSRRRGI